MLDKIDLYKEINIMHKFNRLKNIPFFKGNPRNTNLCLYFNIPGRTDLVPIYYNILMPDFCPYENKPSNFSFIMNTHHKTNVNSLPHVGLVFQCPECHRYCIIDYSLIGDNKSQVYPYTYNFIHPDLSFTKRQLKILSSISPHFEDIYIQAAKADKLHLNMIYPMGYRKALEFLVDGYLIHVIGKSYKTVTNNRLSENIKDTKDPDSINTAQVAAWAGNDSTHLRTRNPELNVVSLKTNLKSFAYFVINKLISRFGKKYIQDNS